MSEPFPRGMHIIDGLTIPQFLAAMAHLSVFVANDTGPVHLAAAGGIPIVLLLDARTPTTYFPNSQKMTVVRGATIHDIAVNDVLAAIVHRKAGGV